ncbi:hypothetical protein [Streptomyces apocyni]|uniref:hypothetical protein n=1 Tax=Streptomyces apocyni TaxID=2654677 RepID=UPI0012EA005D|nr:hypothetical protein [Streptomyces apocyni]
MSDHTDHRGPATRRGFLGLTGKAAAAASAAVGAVAFSVASSGPAAAAAQVDEAVTSRSGELPVVTSPDHPGARIPNVSAADHADGVSREPLNASAECGLSAAAGGMR